MKGIGLRSGKIYEDDERRNAQACCRIITDEKSMDPDYIRNMLATDADFCRFCSGCPMAISAMKGETT